MSKPSRQMSCCVRFGFYLQACAWLGALATSDPAKVDVHAHFVPDFYADALREAGHLPGPDGMPSIPPWTPEKHLEFMENQTIVKSYLSISSPDVYLRVPSRDATAKAVALSRRVNEYTSQLKARYPDRFGFFASLPLPDVEAALAEIEYCFAALDPKPDGIAMMSNYYGMYLGDPELDPVHEALNALNVTIFEHPTMPCTQSNALRFDTNGPAPDISQSEWQALNRPLSSRQPPAPQLDFPFDSARVFADLLAAETPSRFPNLRWIVPHAGGALTTTFDRILGSLPIYSAANATEAALRETLARSFYFDLAGPIPATAAVPPLSRWVDHTRLVYGSDAPWTAWAVAGDVAGASDVGIEEVLGADEREKARSIRRGNADQLLGH